MLQIIEQARKELLASFESLTDEQLNQQPAEDKWSVAQVVMHLSGTETHFASKVAQGLKDAAEKVEEKNLDFVVNRSKKVKGPAEIPNVPKTKAELKQALAESREVLLNLYNSVEDKTNFVNKSFHFPPLGTVSLKQLIDFIGLHEQRHVAQIEEIKQTIA